MSGMIPIPTMRMGDLFVRQRLTRQVQQDQLALFRLQNQLSTGRRIQLPSEDAPAALRAINVQRLLDRKGQIKTNIEASNLYLANAEARVGGVSDILIKLRGEVVGVAGNLAPDSQRQELAQSINGLLQELLSAGNSRLQGRYLFAGSRSQSQPYDFNGSFVEYSGNDGGLRSYVDLERLFDTNLSGTDVFGGISAAVEGSVDLNPQVAADTLVTTLNGGSGIGRDPAITISINDGFATESSVVDLRGAVTIGDVAKLIEAGAPVGTDVSVEITGTGLVLQAAGGVTISVSEVAEGHTARMLGVLSDSVNPATDTITGLDLDPAVLRTTRLSDLLGKKATGRIQFSGNNNDLQLTANVNGVAFNDVDVVFVDGAVAGSESAVYNSGARTLTVTIDDGNSTANQVAAAITGEGTFTATIDYRDATSSIQAGSAAISLGGSPPLTFADATIGGSGEVLDSVSGLHLTNGGKSVALDISGAQTVEDLLNLINGAGLSLVAEVNADGDGISVRSRLSGTDFMIGENGGTTATQLGIRTYTGGTKLASLNRGIGVPRAIQDSSNDFTIIARDGTELSINLFEAAAIDEVLERVNNHASNVPAISGDPKPITARLASVGNGIELIDNTTGAGNLTLRIEEGSRAAEYLGFVPAGETEIISSTGVLQSEDRNTLETETVFNTLIRLRTALEMGNDEEIGRSLERLDTDISRLNFARAEIGGRLQNLGVIGYRLEDENVQLQTALSQDVDVDLVEAISNLTARQYAFEASLRTSASLMQLTLLNFL